MDKKGANLNNKGARLDKKMFVKKGAILDKKGASLDQKKVPNWAINFALKKVRYRAKKVQKKVCEQSKLSCE